MLHDTNYEGFAGQLDCHFLGLPLTLNCPFWSPLISWILPSDHVFFQHPLSSQLFFSSSFSCFCLIVLTWTSLLQNYSWDPFSVWLPDSKLYSTSAWFWLGSKYGDPVDSFNSHFEGLHRLLYHPYHSTPLPHTFWPSLNSCSSSSRFSRCLLYSLYWSITQLY